MSVGLVGGQLAELARSRARRPSSGSPSPGSTALRHAVVADGEVVQRPLGLRTPVAVGRDLDRAHAVGLGAGARRRVVSCVMVRTYLRARSRRLAAPWRSMVRRTYGPSSPAARASAAVCTSAVMTSRSRSMPRTIARGDVVGRAGLDRGRDASPSRPASCAFSAVEPGRVGVGRVRARDDDPVRRAARGAASRPGRAPRTSPARTRVYPNTPMSPAVDDDEHEVAAAALDHRRHHRADRVQRAEVVDVHLVAETRRRAARRSSPGCA